ncbi:hypothetical protein [Aquipuribacter hungaricus]|uniref:Uncharacterized protein n=1 Tax=Aquipuribacter hungaricus TaxID=545624 RepID=A0ABV7WDJ0_9MICO
MRASTHEAVRRTSVRPPDVLWFPFAVLVLLGVGTTLTGIVYLTTVVSSLVTGDPGLQWQALPYGIGVLGLGLGALSGAVALWRQRWRARVMAWVVLPLFVAAGAVDHLVVNDMWGLRVNPFVALLLLLPAVAWAVFLLPSVRRYYQLQSG